MASGLGDPNLIGSVLLCLGGLGLFLLGMVVLTEGLRALAGRALRRLLSRFTRSPFSGAVTGAVTTAVVQSSSATTVATVGFVGAGWLIATVVRRVERPSAVRLAAAMLAGTAIIYACAVAHLALFLRIGFGEAVAIGVVPFLIGDALKLAAAVAFCRATRDRLRVLFP